VQFLGSTRTASVRCRLPRPDRRADVFFALIIRHFRRAIAVRGLIHFWRSLIARGSGTRWTAALWLPLLRSGRACSNGEPLRFASWCNWADLEALLSGRPISVDRAPIVRADLGVSYVLRTEPEVMANILDRV
jgi:hypothetical protein